MWFLLKCHFVVRQRGDRFVVMPNSVHILVRDLAEILRQKSTEDSNSAASDIVFAKVHLPNHDRALYLVACWLAGVDEPLILLTTLVVENIQQAGQIIRYYKRRWVCEEVTRFLKSRVSFERFRIRRYEAIQRLAVLAMLAMGFLTWILLRSRMLTKGFFSFTSRFRKESKFVYYRLLDGMQELARLCRLKCGEILFEPLLKNG
jgi:hypothetical protein